MTQPLAILLYDRLLPGSQLINKLQDLGYRVTTAEGPGTLVETCLREKPLLLFADVGDRGQAICSALKQLRENPETSHIPVIATIPARSPESEAVAREAGAKVVVHDTVILAHLEQFIEAALQID
ncbi:MAG TPA: hypothetical protein DCM86_18775 [Verrucomicrobiales bacterium]|nr:hypothetical protein [Verrucomicrobiales bacterium]